MGTVRHLNVMNIISRTDTFVCKEYLIDSCFLLVLILSYQWIIIYDQFPLLSLVGLLHLTRLILEHHLEVIKYLPLVTVQFLLLVAS